MTLLELKNEIFQREAQLFDPEKDKKYEFVKQFKEKNTSGVVELAGLDIGDFVKAYLCINSKDMSFDECIAVADCIANLCRTVKESAIKSLMAGLLKVTSENRMKSVINFYNANDLVTEASYSIDVRDIHSLFILKTLKSSGYKIHPILYALEKYKKSIFDVISSSLDLCLTHCTIVETIINTVVHEEIAFSSQAAKNKEINIAFMKILKGKCDVEKAFSAFENIKTFIADYSRTKKAQEKERVGLNRAKAILEESRPNSEIVFYSDIAKLIREPRLRCLFLEYILEQNTRYHENLVEELAVLTQDSRNMIQDLMSKYGISKEDYVYEKISRFNYYELEKILKLVARLNISNQMRVRIIETTSMEQVNALNNLLEQSLIPLSFVAAHTEIFEKGSKLLFNLRDNLELLKGYSVPISLFETSKIILSNPITIGESLKVLAEYNLLNSISSASDYSFLLNTSLASTIDKYLELGYELYLRNDLSLLNKKELRRLDIYKTIGIEIGSKEELEQVLDESKTFFVPSANIDEYFSADDMFDEQEEDLSLEKLEEHRISRLLYEINGTKISALKVKRLLDNGFSLFQAIFYNLTIDAEQKNIIIKALKTKSIQQKTAQS